MKKLHKLSISKLTAVILCIVLLHGGFYLSPSGIPAQENPSPTAPGHEELHRQFASALKDYHAGSYRKTAAALVAILAEKEEIEPSLKAKIYILLGACHEHSGNKEKAKQCFSELKKMADKGTIDHLPIVPGIEPGSLLAYREVFDEKSHFEFQEPMEVSEMLRKNVVHAPRKSSEQKQKEKKKKKFPWLIAVGAVVVLGTAAVLLYTQRKNTIKEAEIPEIEWVKIPAGEFLMGDNFNEGGADEQPVHKVYLDEYYISKFEVNGNLYRAFCDATSKTYEWDHKSRPAIGVSWEEAKVFCDWLSDQTGENIRLPTEAQWEKAARGTDQRRYPWGNSPPDDNKAYFSKGPNTVPVIVREDRRPEGQSPYGIYDMAGNAAEWCRDWYDPSYYAVSPERNPTGPASGVYRVVRGGSCKDEAEGIRSSRREFYQSQTRTKHIGFRIVKER